MKEKLKILELCPFSAGICGVWQRVRQESIELIKKGYSVKIFSSNLEKGTDKIVSSRDKLNNEIDIYRFPAIKLGGESFMSWFKKEAEKEALEYMPDIIIAHNYRHLHTTKALRVARKLKKMGRKCRVFLVSHAPFERNETRTLMQRIIVWLYDKFIGRATINNFDKIIMISKWELPYLKGLNVDESKIVYIPNGIPEEFFLQKKYKKEENKILFLGRISPIKNLEVLIKAVSIKKDKSIAIEIVGPAEKEYLDKIKELVEKLNLKDRIVFSPPIYDLKDKIKKIDSAKIFVLPSKIEGMPQGLIEAMARGKIVIGSDCMAIKELIKENENGYLFKSDDYLDLAEKIDFVLKNKIKNREIKRNAMNFVKQFRWNYLINELERLIKS